MSPSLNGENTYPKSSFTRASGQEDYFSTLIRLRLFSPVNSKTDAKNAIVSRSVLYYGETTTVAPRLRPKSWRRPGLSAAAVRATRRLANSAGIRLSKPFLATQSWHLLRIAF